MTAIEAYNISRATKVEAGSRYADIQHMIEEEAKDGGSECHVPFCGEDADDVRWMVSKLEEDGFEVKTVPGSSWRPSCYEISWRHPKC